MTSTSAPIPNMLPTPNKNPNKKTTILLFGETGNGKSTLGNHLLGEDAFSVSDDVKAETKLTYGKRGKGNSSNLFIIDTPGLQDTSGADKQHMIQLVEYVKDHKELNAILVVFNYQQVRFPYNIQTMLKLFCNIFPMKDVGMHIALVFTNCFTKRGVLTPEQKHKKAEKILPEFRRVIKEASGCDLPTTIPTAFVDMDPDEGIDDNGKQDLERILTWANFLENLNVDSINTPEPEVKIESQDFNEMKIEGEYIIKTTIKKERKVFCQLDGSISYGEWEEKDRKEEKIMNPEIEKIKKLNLDNEQTLKRIQEDNEKRIKELREENEKMQEKTHKQFLELVASNKKGEDNMASYRMMMLEEDRRRREDEERRIRQEKDEEKRQKLERELQEKKEKEKQKEQHRKYLEKLLLEIKNTARNSKEDKKGECEEGKNEFSAGVTQEDELIKEASLSVEESTLKGEWAFAGNLTKTLEKTFGGKTIVGWKLKSNHDDGKGGFWERKSEVLGTSSYTFFVSSFFSRGCDWKLKIWVVDNVLPFDLE